MVEIGGSFLFIEGKPGAFMKEGQRKALYRLAGLGCTVIQLEGIAPRGVVGWRELLNPNNEHWGVGWSCREHSGDYAAFVRFIKEWAVRAEESKPLAKANCSRAR